jgi:hypothetical protein
MIANECNRLAKVGFPVAVACDLKTRLQQSAQDLRALLVTLPDHPAVTDVCDYTLGAYYGLGHAMSLGFVNRPGPWQSAYRPHLTQYVERMLKGMPVNRRWIAGFYFNSAIQRIAACFDRVPKLLKVGGKNAFKRMGAANTGSYTAWGKVYAEMNVYKHDPAGRAAGRTVTVEDAVAAFGELVKLLKASETRLTDLYS